MIKKRFIIENERTIKDTETQQRYVCSFKADAEELVILLNNQEETIEYLEEECGARENDYVNLQNRIKKNCVLNSDAKYPCKAYDECSERQGTNKPLPCMVNWIMGKTFGSMIEFKDDKEKQIYELKEENKRLKNINRILQEKIDNIQEILKILNNNLRGDWNE